MTTQAAEQLYVAQHNMEQEGKGYAVYNPNSLPIKNLPIIYGFNNGGSPQWYSAILMAEDGTELGGHCCSHEGYMTHDLGILKGTRPDRHETFKAHYPKGYRMDFVPYSDVFTHEGLTKALALNKEILK